MSFIRNFLRREHGVVSLEWVALASGLVIAAIVIGVLLLDETADEASGIADGIGLNAPTVVGNAQNLKPYAP